MVGTASCFIAIPLLVAKTDFTGTLVTDCYSAYIAHSAGAKQKCLSHLARTARDWQKLTKAASTDHSFFEAVKQFVKRGCAFHRLRGKALLSAAEIAAEKQWQRDEQVRLETWSLTHKKALTLQARIIAYHDEWLVFVDDPRVPPTNNLAEQALRPGGPSQDHLRTSQTHGTRADGGSHVGRRNGSSPRPPRERNLSGVDDSSTQRGVAAVLCQSLNPATGGDDAHRRC